MNWNLPHSNSCRCEQPLLNLCLHLGLLLRECLCLKLCMPGFCLRSKLGLLLSVGFGLLLDVGFCLSEELGLLLYFGLGLGKRLLLLLNFCPCELID